MSRPVPPHLQAKFVPSITSLDIGVPKQAIQIQNSAMQQHLASDHNIPMVPQLTTAPVNESAMHPGQSISTAELTPEQRFLAFIDQKSAKDIEAKKKAMANKALLSAVQTQPVQEAITAGVHQSQSSEGQPSMLQVPRSKFRPTEQTDKEMIAFVSNKVSAPATNGRKYVFNGGQASSQIPLAASKPAKNSDGLQAAASNQKENFNAVDNFNPSFGPSNLAGQISSIK